MKLGLLGVGPWWGWAAEVDRFEDGHSQDLSFLGLSWRWWGRLLLISWLLWAAWSWVWVATRWISGTGVSSDSLMEAVLPVSCGVPVGLHGLVAAAAWWQGRTDLPVGAAAVFLTVSFLLGGGTSFVWLVSSGEPGWAWVGGITLGMMAFPLTFGLVFPLGVPLLSALWSGARVARGRPLSGYAHAGLLAVSSFAWVLVCSIGILLGFGA